ncbi:MAG TPA: hypothetical protein VHX37_00510 [Acidobacteriaceae bacterium]|jgi:hypothetical protein|nr:hypothetical protein [Acidobacteriaceae bacterium]
MSLIPVVLGLALALLPFPVGAQGSAPPLAPGGAGDPAPRLVSARLRPALSGISQAVAGLSVRRWKAPGDVRDATQQDVASIQRDLSGTLAGLLDQADAAPASVPAQFAVYRNVDALYDTLLRVVLTADLAAPENEAGSLQAALTNLESARTNLSDSILSSAQTQQAEFVRMRSVIAAAEAAARRQPPRTTVVDDGPAREARKETTTHHHTTTKKPPAKTDTTKPNPQ